jgi:hypothetical protein
MKTMIQNGLVLPAPVPVRASPVLRFAGQAS